MEYFSGRTFKTMEGMKDTLKTYREKLMTHHITQRIGERYVRDYLPVLIKGQEDLFENKEGLDKQFLMSKSETVTPAMIEDYNRIFNNSIDKIRKQMPKELYEKFFGLPYEQKIDVRMLLTKELADKWGIK